MLTYNGGQKQFKADVDNWFEKTATRPNLLIPKWTNGAFAAELALKYLFVREQISYGAIHDLQGLLHGLPEAHQTELMTRMKDQAHQTDEMIREQLKIFSDAFVKSRYFYEHDLFGLTGLFEPFVKIVCAYAFEIDGQGASYRSRGKSEEFSTCT